MMSGTSSRISAGTASLAYPRLSAVCVFCGSAPGHSPKYRDAAQRLGAALANAGITLIYGGGKTGLMGALANAVLAEGGQVVGVITRAMNTPELAHHGLSRLDVTTTLHERKATMHHLANAYIALPGGYGTLDELFETLTWGQVGEHEKAVGLLNVDGYFAPLLAMLDRAVTDGFLYAEHRNALLSAADPRELLDSMNQHAHPTEACVRWMKQE